jgi:AAA domain
MYTFESILLKRWRQFEVVDLDLRPRMCVLTGPNGCGKTTILNVLGRHFGWNLSFLSSSFLTKGCDLNLISSATDVFDRAIVGKNLMIVTAVDGVLHFRMFDGHGKVVVDTDENSLSGQASKIETFKLQLASLWPPHPLSSNEKRQVIAAAASILGHNLTAEGKRIYADAWDVVDEQVEHRTEIGTLKYTGGITAQINAPVTTATQYDVEIQGQQQIHGLHIPSHRPPPRLRAAR